MKPRPFSPSKRSTIAPAEPSRTIGSTAVGGTIINRQWFREGVELVQAVFDFDIRGKVLELGGGTGYWTQHLVMGADHVTVVDVSAESIAASRKRLGPFVQKVKYIEADVYRWHPTERYDVVFF